MLKQCNQITLLLPDHLLILRKHIKLAEIITTLALALPQQAMHATAFNPQAFVVPHEAQLRRGADLGGASAVEGVGLQDVGPSFQELVVDTSNDVGAGDDQQVVVALQLIRVALVPIPPEVLLTQSVHIK